MVLPPKADFFLSKYTLVSIPANYNNLLPGKACNVPIGCSPALKSVKLELPHNSKTREGKGEQSQKYQTDGS